MKIATYNVRNLFDEGERAGYTDQIYISKEFVDAVVTELSSTLKMIDADIFVLQEVASKKVLERIVANLPRKYEIFLAPPDQRGIGNALLTRIPAQISKQTDVGSFPVLAKGDEDVIGKNLLSAREFIVAQTTYQDRPLFIFGLHLKSIGPLPLRESRDGSRIPTISQSEESDAIIRSSIFRLAQAKQMRKLVDEQFRKDPEAQIIVLGDFNSLEHSDTVRAITGTAKFPDAQLFDVCVHVPKEKRYSFIARDAHILIDHILVSPSLLPHVSLVEIMNAELKDQMVGPETDFMTSDHAPIILSLRS